MEGVEEMTNPQISGRGVVEARSRAKVDPTKPQIPAIRTFTLRIMVISASREKGFSTQVGGQKSKTF